jgi:DNA-binding transcriptional LysR family regulator
VELRQLQYFIAVAEQLNFGRAAQTLGVGQPVVSQQVARLERELGALLLDRTSRQVQLTAAGRRFQPEAEAVLAACERARRAVGEPSGGTRTIRLGSSTGLGDRLHELLQVLADDAADIDVELVSAPTEVRLGRVRSGQLDAAFVRGIEAAPGLEIIPVWQDPLVVALPSTHPLADQDAIVLAALASVPLRIVSRSRNRPLVDLVMRACASAGFEPVLGQRMDNLEDTLAAIGAGTPSWTLVYAAHARNLRSHRVAFRPVREPELVMSTGLAVPAEATSRSLAPLLRACRLAAAAGQPARAADIDRRQ